MPSYKKIDIKVIPGSSRNEVGEMIGGRLKVKVTAPPTDGEANTKVIEVISNALRKPKAYVKILYGANSTDKTIEVLCHNDSDLDVLFPEK